MKQAELAAINKKAWEADAYATWVKAYGTPDEQAAILKADPKKKLGRILPHLDSLQGKIIANPLGSHGRVAVSMALLGAEVTVFDISEPNARYGLELANAANTSITYVTSDFIKSTEDKQYNQHFDLIILELGILHYFLDLDSFIEALSQILKPNGQLILNEFHPLNRKGFQEDTQVFTGDYFDSRTQTVPVAYADFHKTPELLPTCLVRYWTLGEVVTSFAQNNFRIEKLVELATRQNPKVPAQFTLVASKVANPT